MEQQTLQMRVLAEVAGDNPAPSSWFNSDFWKTAAAAVSNIITVAVLIGWVRATDSEALTESVVALVGAAEVIFINSALIWRHLTAKKEVEIEQLRAKVMLAQQMPNAPLEMCVPPHLRNKPLNPAVPPQKQLRKPKG